jgi:phage tail sheath protein FI
MAGIYKTPGVYVEEITKFPPSIAPVETAIPAFVGYTEKAVRDGAQLDKPIRIESIAEYEEIFGGGPPQDIEVYLDSDNNYVRAKKNKGFLLYDSLRMFYGNGGGNCYIVSVGNYADTLDMNKLKKGLDKLENEDEPTILLFPDAINLNGTELYEVQTAALAQCKKLMDRVTLCDLKFNADFKASVTDFRDNIGINNLKYGAAYGPWMNANISRVVSHRDVKLRRDVGVAEVKLDNLTTDDSIKQLLFDVSKAEKVVDTLVEDEAKTTSPDTKKTWKEQLKLKSDLYDSKANPKPEPLTPLTFKGLEIELQNIYNLLATILGNVQDMVDTLPIIADKPKPISNETNQFNIKTVIDQYITGAKLQLTFNSLIEHFLYVRDNIANKPKLFSEGPGAAPAPATPAPPAPVIGNDTNLYKTLFLLKYIPENATPEDAAKKFNEVLFSSDLSSAYTGKTKQKEKADFAKDAAMNASSDIIAFYRFVQKSAAEYEKQFNDALLKGFGAYKNIVTKAIESLNQLPPSGAIAGVYASVDRDRGVWKAPANVSLNAVISPVVKISQEQQGEYNVDVNAGKSINIIRSFPGKGVLVWGARTLAGNDNEWRYISVRRFFNFVEESTKKATEQFVFEPNDANTWVRIQAMIENFLTMLWRQGALQGIKPEHAFYVAVGLGKTMTPIDILEGRLIIEIGMAAVRPAEFIILKFSHKMAES